jgi:phage shock protein A
MLEQKIQEAKSKKDTLKARAQSAKTSKQVQEMVGGLSSSNAMAAFERMEEKVRVC